MNQRASLAKLRSPRYLTTLDFIHICRDLKGEERYAAFMKASGFSARLTRERNQIESIMDFIAYVDRKYHLLDNRRITFLHYTIHEHISSDLRSLIILALSKQNYQLNIVLRHFIEVFTITMWADIITKFKGTYNFYLDTKEWKKYRHPQKMTWDCNNEYPTRSIKVRLDRIRLLNLVNKEGKRFYNYYLKNASKGDLLNLISLPICENCVNEPRWRNNVRHFKFVIDKPLRRRGKEASNARFKTDFSYICAFCNKQRVTKRYALGIPTASDMSKMLIAITDEQLVNNLAHLSKLYSHLSEDYVHFSTTVSSDRKPRAKSSQGALPVIWGLSGVNYAIRLLRPLMENYFELLQKNRRRKLR